VENIGISWGSETTSLVVVVLVFAIIIWYITKPDSGTEKAYQRI